MNTKRILSVIAVTLITFTAATAQRISVVTENGTTSVFRTLQEAIEGADSGSTIYLPGGGFTLPDSVKITKRLTIIGIGHKSDNENADGSTIISGNVFFNQGSSGSAVMACYITGNVNIGEGDAAVNDVTIRFCNLNSVQVKNSTCQETVVNQNFIRGNSNFWETNAQISNNILHSVQKLNCGTLNNNIITSRYSTSTYGSNTIGANNCIISYNVILPKYYSKDRNGFYSNLIEGAGNTCEGNMTIVDTFGDNCIILGIEDWNDVFDNYNGAAISPVSRFHFKGDYAQYEHQVGIYAGDGFNEDQLAPVPFIISKSIPQQTDAAGKLNIKIRVKAGD